MEEPRFPVDLPVWASLGDAWRVYRLLFSRSVLVAAIVYGVIALLQIGGHVAPGGWATLFGFLAFLCIFAGPALVQGALIQIVRNVHEGRAPEPARRLFAGASSRLATLIGAAFVYALGVIIGLVLLVVPGLVVMARWALMPAVVMLEGRGVWAARDRSSQLVKGHGTAVFSCLMLSFMAVVGGSFTLLALHLGFGTGTFVDFVWSSLTAPFIAHLLTVIYYRRADQWEPVIHPAVLSWRNVWEGR